MVENKSSRQYEVLIPQSGTNYIFGDYPHENLSQQTKKVNKCVFRTSIKIPKQDSKPHFKPKITSKKPPKKRSEIKQTPQKLTSKFSKNQTFTEEIMTKSPFIRNLHAQLTKPTTQSFNEADK
jgi:hypothetical protein